MKRLINKRVFDRAQDKKRVPITVQVSVHMQEAMEEVAELLGRTVEELIVGGIECFLQECAREKLIKVPGARVKEIKNNGDKKAVA